jgi:hypothetical protein
VIPNYSKEIAAARMPSAENEDKMKMERRYNTHTFQDQRGVHRIATIFIMRGNIDSAI